jgi:hypothetical protein
VPGFLQALQLFGGFPFGRVFVEFEESQRVDGAAGLEFADEAAGRPQVLGKKIVEAANRSRTCGASTSPAVPGASTVGIRNNVPVVAAIASRNKYCVLVGY